MIPSNTSTSCVSGRQHMVGKSPRRSLANLRDLEDDKGYWKVRGVSRIPNNVDVLRPARLEALVLSIAVASERKLSSMVLIS